jgi:hypothetical protein
MRSDPAIPEHLDEQAMDWPAPSPVERLIRGRRYRIDGNVLVALEPLPRHKASRPRPARSKVQRPPLQPKAPKTPKAPESRLCEDCGEHYVVAQNAIQRFCSRTCGTRAKHRRQREARRAS